MDHEGTSQKTPKLPYHGVGKGLMASQGPVTPAPITLLVRSKQLTVETVQSIIKDANLNKCFEHETKSLGEV